MRPPREIIAQLADRELLEIAAQVATMHRLPLGAIVDSGRHDPELVAARHALFARLRGVLPSASAVARVLGVDRTTVSLALREEAEIVEVELARFEAPPGDGVAGYIFRWRRRAAPFGVVTLRATAGDSPGLWEASIDWFDRYPLARAHFDRLCVASGAPSFAGHAYPRATEEDPPAASSPAVAAEVLS